MISITNISCVINKNTRSLINGTNGILSCSLSICQETMKEHSVAEQPDRWTEHVKKTATILIIFERIKPKRFLLRISDLFIYAFLSVKLC